MMVSGLPSLAAKDKHGPAHPDGIPRDCCTILKNLIESVVKYVAFYCRRRESVIKYVGLYGRRRESVVKYVGLYGRRRESVVKYIGLYGRRRESGGLKNQKISGLKKRAP